MIHLINKYPLGAPCARLCIRSWGFSDAQNRNSPCSVDADVIIRKTDQNHPHNITVTKKFEKYLPVGISGINETDKKLS